MPKPNQVSIACVHTGKVFWEPLSRFLCACSPAAANRDVPNKSLWVLKDETEQTDALPKEGLRIAVRPTPGWTVSRSAKLPDQHSNRAAAAMALARFGKGRDVIPTLLTWRKDVTEARGDPFEDGNKSRIVRSRRPTIASVAAFPHTRQRTRTFPSSPTLIDRLGR